VDFSQLMVAKPHVLAAAEPPTATSLAPLRR
jgi:hypothetical protein